MRTFSESFQWYCQRCVAIYFCDLALVPLVCIARICGRARWLSFPMNTALPAPYSTRDTIRFCEHRHDTSGVVLSTSGVLKELLSSVHHDVLHGPHMCMYMSTCGVVPRKHAYNAINKRHSLHVSCSCEVLSAMQHCMHNRWQ